jgi:hypothetical protein
MFFDDGTRTLRNVWATLASAGLLVLLIGSGAATDVRAQGKTKQARTRVAYEAIQPDWNDCGLRKEAVNAFVSHRPPPAALRKAKTAVIEVEYGSGFSSEARQAFQRAVEIWERHVRSDVTITIDAAFEELDTDVLGGAGPQFVYTDDTDGDGRPDAFFGDALLDAREGTEQQPGEPDIVARFNSGRDDWHFGEGAAPAGTIDFTTIVLHEIGHGLNYFGQTDVDETGVGRYGVVDFNQDGQPDGIPSIFTRFLAEQAGNGALTLLTNEGAFPNPSRELGNALTGGRLVFEGAESNEAADGSDSPTPAKMYAPASYEQGSSISHLDERTYGVEGENSLMTPQIATAETVRLPGPVVCGQLADMGWALGSQCQQYFQAITNLRFTDDASPSSVTLTWEEKPDARVQEYQIERRDFDGAFETVKTGIPAPPVTIDELGLGRFAFRLRWVNDDGTEGMSATVLERTVNLQSLSPSVSAGASGRRATVELAWTVPTGTSEGTTFRVERAPGREGGTFRTVDGRTERLSSRGYRFTAERQTPGQYRYRVVARDGQGNELESEPEPVDISFDGDVFIAGPSPNPAQNRAVVELTAQQTQDASVAVYNSIGKRVYVEERRLDGQRPVRLVLDTRRWGSGVYFFRVTARDFAKTRKMVVVR